MNKLLYKYFLGYALAKGVVKAFKKKKPVTLSVIGNVIKSVYTQEDLLKQQPLLSLYESSR